MSGLNLVAFHPDRGLVRQWAARHRLRDGSGDCGYALHGLLAAVFGPQAPAVFHWDAGGALYAYFGLGEEDVRARCAGADRGAQEALGVHGADGFGIKPMPSEWPQGLRLSFQVRVRPVVRETKTGREVDAFKHCGAAGADRESVYADWLRRSLQGAASAALHPWQGGVELQDVHMTHFRLQPVVRRGAPTEGGRSEVLVGGPDAHLAGVIRVTDSDRFNALLARGVGRHRAFGYGMMLLRAAVQVTGE